jgi:RES domain-containing protein
LTNWTDYSVGRVQNQARGDTQRGVGRAALYASISPETASLEAQQEFPFTTQPMTLCAYDVDCEAILGLTTDHCPVAAGTSLTDVGCAWEDLALTSRSVPPWQLADWLIADGRAGIVVPSFAHRATTRDINLVIWKWASAPPYRIAVVDDERHLPINQDSWKPSPASRG